MSTDDDVQPKKQPVTGEHRCLWCDGTGQYAATWAGPRVPCSQCDATGDRRVGPRTAKSPQ
jgi:hypothetical protein